MDHAGLYAVCTGHALLALEEHSTVRPYPGGPRAHVGALGLDEVEVAAAGPRGPPV